MTLKKPDAVLIDDDVLVRLSWQMAAKQEGKTLVLFPAPKDFLVSMEHFDPSTPIYVDSNLGNGILGEEVAHEIYQAGFKNIYLCTGYPAKQFAHLTWLKGVLGKDSPWTQSE